MNRRRVLLALIPPNVALAVLIETEMVEPTMPWRELLPAVATRARNLAEQAQGR